ncbi:ankyrin repeat domain-containing protein [Methylovulum psychrotolerans]|uniref:Uncharacterized protein n=2 Tax=Methylovulum psychrotolerans TaxID=1704499 RepID=A0A1Z4C1D9_9GAMM|nr:ankyrin repeat domain-containing protein [Methylovulum psychrotolerans]ASF47347.1 hypothetical protein CEK71_15465 [Methylovulum psychrotolerans]
MRNRLIYCGVNEYLAAQNPLQSVTIMLTLEEILSDVADLPSFENVKNIGVNSQGNNGKAPLHWMATLGDTIAIQLLLEAGADANLADNDGNTPLHEAISCRQERAAKILIEACANLDYKNKAGMTPLEIAESDNYQPTIELFSVTSRNL